MIHSQQMHKMFG